MKEITTQKTGGPVQHVQYPDNNPNTNSCPPKETQTITPKSANPKEILSYTDSIDISPRLQKIRSIECMLSLKGIFVHLCLGQLAARMLCHVCNHEPLKS